MSFTVRLKQGQRAFSKGQQQLKNSGNEVLFPKIFTELKNPSRSTCLNLHTEHTHTHTHTQRKQTEKTGRDV